MNDISSNFKFNYYDSHIAREIVKREKTPEAIKYFSEHCDKLTNYAYWFFLSTLWVSYTGYSDINLWKKLFASNRSQRLKSIMKPSEVKEYENLPYIVTIYRAKRPNETQWIAYTLDFEIAKRFAKERNVNEIYKYEVKKKDILALFLRRGEKEVIVLDENKPRFISKEYIKQEREQMEKVSNIDFNNDMLKELRENLESKINLALKYSIKNEKTTKINLKMLIEVSRNHEGEKIPKITYETGFSIKENGFKDKNTIHSDFRAELDENENIVIKKNDEQQEVDENGNMSIKDNEQIRKNGGIKNL